MPHKRIYFDTNVFAIVKKRLIVHAADYDLIKRAIKLDFIMIPGSLAVLEEALPLYRSKSPTLFALEKQTYAEIMNWQVFIKYHSILLRDEIMAYIYRKCRFGEKITPSDSRDYHHVASSAATHIFVIEDGQFAQLLEQMPIPNYTVWSYKQFIKWLSKALAGWQAAGLQMRDSYYSRPWHK